MRGKSITYRPQRPGPTTAIRRRGFPLKSILLVEDSKFLRLVNERTLMRAGYGVITASDGKEALRLATEKVPDLILLDMLLPRLGGLQVVQRLRNNPLTAR